MVRVAGANASAPPLPTMTVCVRPGIVGAVTPCVVVEVTPATVVVVTSVQLPALQLSQQLDVVPTHAEPPLGAAHVVWLDFTEHLVTPFAVVRQQVTKPDSPQVDRFAQRTTIARHCVGRLPLFTAASAFCVTHRTYDL